MKFLVLKIFKIIINGYYGYIYMPEIALHIFVIIYNCWFKKQNLVSVVLTFQNILKRKITCLFEYYSFFVVLALEQQ